MGYREEITTRIKPAWAQVYALVPYKVEDLTVRIDSPIIRGEAISVSIAITAIGGAPERHCVRIDVIGPDGKIHDRYDKRFCTEIDLGNYTPGNRFVFFDINGVKCSLLICFDLRFPEIYRALCKEKVQCIFQSFYNARQKGPSVHTDIMRQSMQCRAATNYFWVSMTNSCGWFCPYPSCFIQPDGKIIAQLEDHKEGLMINTVDTNISLYDPSAPFRNAAINGHLSNGPETINDPKSKDNKTL